MKEREYNDLKEKITNGKLQPGDAIIEREIGECYGISRTPVREILWRLAADGLLTQEPGKGYTVRKLSLNDIFEIFQTREGLEGMAARLACQRNDGKFISYIKEARKKLINIDIASETEEAVAIGHAIHTAIIEVSGNSFIEEFYNKLLNLTALTNSLAKNYVDLESESLKYHLLIVDAILAGDEDKSEMAMRDHLKITCLLLADYHYPDLFKLMSNR